MSEKYLGEVSTPILIQQIKDKCTLQYSTMPTATSSLVGKIVQYVGTSTSTYRNGSYYKCVSDGQSPATYSWQMFNETVRILNTMPNPTSTSEAWGVVQYMGSNTGTYRKGYFYTIDYVNGVRSWVNLKVQPSNVYNVLDYGLKADGTTDNSTALTRMINTVPSGSTLYFPSGVYNFNSSINIPKSLSFKGDTENIQASANESSVESVINYAGDTANTTLLMRTANYADVFLTNLTFKGNAFTITNNDAEFTTLPYSYFIENTTLAGINAVDIHTYVGEAHIENCVFKGFSGYAIKAREHKIINNCGFYNCKIAVKATYDSLIQNCWICKCGTAVDMIPSTTLGNEFVSVNISDCWADQLAEHFVSTDSTSTAQLIIDNVWVDSVDGSAFYFPNCVLNKSTVNGVFGRVGITYAGLQDTDRTDTKAQMSDFVYAKRLVENTFEITIPNITMGKGNNPNGECFSKLFSVNNNIIQDCYFKCINFNKDRFIGFGTPTNVKIIAKDTKVVTSKDRAIGQYVKTGLNTAGWYKIYEGATHSQGEVLRIDLGSFYNNAQNCGHAIDIAYGYKSANISETCRDGQSIFSKIRVCYNDNPSTSKNTILVYYNQNVGNGVYANILSTQYDDNGEAFSFVAVDASQYTTYREFNLGTNGTYANGVKVITESDISYLSRDKLMYHQETGTDVLYAVAVDWQLPINNTYLVHVTASDKNSPADNYDGIIKFTYGGAGAITNIGHYKLSGTGSIDATNNYGTLQFSFVNGLPEVCVAFLG